MTREAYLLARAGDEQRVQLAQSQLQRSLARKQVAASREQFFAARAKLVS